MAASLLERGLVDGPGEVGSRSSSRRFAVNADVRMESAFGDLATKQPPPPGLVLVDSQLSGPTLAHEKSSACGGRSRPGRPVQLRVAARPR
jgi:hypothetical protein